jgi:hypothetical protein
MARVIRCGRGEISKMTARIPKDNVVGDRGRRRCVSKDRTLDQTKLHILYVRERTLVVWAMVSVF